jgi:hypothetical protein
VCAAKQKLKGIIPSLSYFPIATTCGRDDKEDQVESARKQTHTTRIRACVHIGAARPHMYMMYARTCSLQQERRDGSWHPLSAVHRYEIRRLPLLSPIHAWTIAKCASLQMAEANESDREL